MFKIEKGIPLPDRANGRGKKYPFTEMSVGDSFLIPGGAKKQASVSGYASIVQRGTGRKFATRKDGPDLRVWRTA